MTKLIVAFRNFANALKNDRMQPKTDSFNVARYSADFVFWKIPTSKRRDNVEIFLLN